MSAPARTMACPCATAESRCRYRPPSENESGVTLRTPITRQRCGCWAPPLAAREHLVEGSSRRPRAGAVNARSRVTGCHDSCSVTPVLGRTSAANAVAGGRDQVQRTGDDDQPVGTRGGDGVAQRHPDVGVAMAGRTGSRAAAVQPTCDRPNSSNAPVLR